MRQVMVGAYGGPENLQVVEVPTPDPGPGEVLVRVAAAGVNYLDLLQRNGAGRLPLPLALGLEGAGRVVATGSGVDDRAVGDRVCWAMVPGAGYAEFVRVPAARCVTVPDDVDLETAAAVLLQGLTADMLLRTTYPVSAGDGVVVQADAARGGLVTQAAVSIGARVFAFASTPEKLDRVRAMGVEDAFLSTELDEATAKIRTATGGGAHVVYDGVGRATFDAGLDMLRIRGFMVLYGASSGAVAPVDPQTLNAKGSLYLTRPGLNAHIADRQELEDRAARVFAWVRAGHVSVHIGGSYRFDDARRAHEAIGSRASTGKVLLVPG